MSTVHTVVWSSWGGAVLLMVVMSLWQWRKLRYRENAMQVWPHTQAVVVGRSSSVDSAIDSFGDHSSASVYQYAGPDGVTRQGRTVWSAHRPLPVHSRLEVCVNPVDPAESFPVEKVSRGLLGAMLAFQVVFLGASFFVRFLTQA